MSKIYFHSIDADLLKEASVRGSERAHFSIFCSDMTWVIIRCIADESTGKRSILRNVFPPEHYALKSDNFSEAAALYFRVGDELLILGEKQVDLFALKLNTVCYLGSDQVRLGARLHGQCEIHAYVEGPNRRWLADIIKRGRAFEFFRYDAGWESVIKLLEEDDSSPVVTSYSVCEPFPNPSIADFHPVRLPNGEPDWDRWYDLPEREQWKTGIAGLRKAGGWLEMKPENWDSYYFGDGMDANQFVAELRELYPIHQGGT